MIGGRVLFGATAALAMTTTSWCQGPPPDQFAHLERVLGAAVAKAAPSVARVETFGGVRRVLADTGDPTERPGPDDPDSARPRPEEEESRPLVQPGFLQAQGATTGVVLTADGWILVSRFALNYDPATVLVTLADGRSFNATRAGEDTSRGLALVKIDAADLPVPEFAPLDAVRVGQWAFVLGRTFGREQPSVHMGIVSAKGRLFGRALQTDAATSPANYGGPLIDIEGRVLGVSVPLSRSGRDAGAELYDSGIGFAATIVDIGPLLERMKEGESLHRGWLGVSTVPSHLGPGAWIGDVHKEGTDELQRGDLVMEVDGVGVKNGFHLQNLVSAKMGGDRVEFTVAREGATRSLSFVLRDLPAERRESVESTEEAGVQPWEEDDKKPSGR